MSSTAATITLPKLIDDKQLAEWLGVSPGTPANWRHQGTADQPPYVKMGGRTIRYRVEDVEEYLARQAQDPTGGEMSYPSRCTPSAVSRLSPRRRRTAAQLFAAIRFRSGKVFLDSRTMIALQEATRLTHQQLQQAGDDLYELGHVAASMIGDVEVLAILPGEDGRAIGGRHG